MRKFLTIAVIALTAALGAGAADAQVRFKVFVNPGVMAPKTPRVRINPVRPKMVFILPSKALTIASRMMPGAKAISVQLRGQTYIVRLKSRGTVAKIGVNSVTGAASPLP